ncbi:ATP-binding cassette domain-containing protein [Bacterioplanes sanyensis]|nr:ATP-binding cassette domain-containing protein [Bacterioplanes sanyensis]
MAVLQLQQFELRLADGRRLFQPIDLVLDRQFYVLTGRNGVGKSLLMAALAGLTNVSCQGQLVRHQPTTYLPQSAMTETETFSAALSLGNPTLEQQLAALKRLRLGIGRIGTGTDDDISLVADNWLLEQQLGEYLPAPLQLYDDWRHLSGGERMRCLLAAKLAGNEFLLLDEPSNHLDHVNKEWLAQQLRTRTTGALVISHDPVLLQAASHILLLTEQGIEVFSAGFEAYQQCLQHRLERQCQQAQQWQRQQRQLLETAQTMRQRAARRTAQGRQQVRDGSQGKALGDFRARRASQSLGGLNRRMAQRLHTHQAQRISMPAAVHNRLYAPHGKNQHSLWLNAVLPISGHPTVQLQMQAGECVWLQGRNGCGKTTLLRCLSGQQSFAAGEYSLPNAFLYLDQHASCLDQALTAMAFLQQALPGTDATELRTLLAGIGLKRERASDTISTLSGGEKMKLALLLAHQQQAWLLLDEPDNHLDAQAQDDLVDWLNRLENGFILVTHNQYLAKKIEGLTTVVMGSDTGEGN